MSEQIHTITKTLVTGADSQLEPTFVLGELRRLVREVKHDEPTLAGAKLFDLSFIQSEEGLDVKMYFAQS